MGGARPAAGPFVLPLAPDRLHKDNVSGGPPYGIIVPDGCADRLRAGQTTGSSATAGSPACRL
jgi:hypothetical protein